MDLKKTDTETLKRTLSDLIQELERKGLVDHNFRQCYSLKEDSGRSFFLELIPVFLNDVNTIVKDMVVNLTQAVVDFDRMFSHFIKLKGSSACFGACRIRDVSCNLHSAIEKKSRDECRRVLEDIKFEYIDLQKHLEVIIQLEQEIVSRSA